MATVSTNENVGRRRAKQANLDNEGDNIFNQGHDLHPGDQLLTLARDLGKDVEDVDFALHMDSLDPLRELRNDFHYPKMKDLYSTDLSLVDRDEDCVYFCGNSLGLCPRDTKRLMDGQLERWASLAVQGLFDRDVPWIYGDEAVDGDMATIVGAEEGEVAVMNGLSVNMHLQLISFYRPTPKRHKILCEANAFPSDHFVFESQMRLHGYDPATSLLCIQPRKGEHTLRTEDILRKMEEEGESIAVVCLPGVQYYTGQLFDVKTITAAGQKKGCYVGWDMAHAAGNVELHLHDWNVDFASWCNYKYVNGGSGGLAGFFLHSRHHGNDFPKLQGWWGHKTDTRFHMKNVIDPTPGARGYRISNPPGFLAVPLRASMEVFKKTSMSAIVAKSRLLTGYLELLIRRAYGSPGGGEGVGVEVLTPSDPGQRGAQLSLAFTLHVDPVHAELGRRGVVCDKRQPSVIRLAPAPLYCSFHDVHRFMKYLAQSLEAAKNSPEPSGIGNPH